MHDTSPRVNSLWAKQQGSDNDPTCRLRHNPHRNMKCLPLHHATAPALAYPPATQRFTCCLRNAQGSSLPHGKRNSLVLFFDEILPAKIRKGEVSHLAWCTNAILNLLSSIASYHVIHAPQWYACLRARFSHSPFHAMPCSCCGAASW